MTLFILMSLLLVVVLLALALKPLWTRQRRLAGILLLGSALSIGGLYWLIGRPEAIDHFIHARRAIDRQGSGR